MVGRCGDGWARCVARHDDVLCCEINETHDETAEHALLRRFLYSLIPVIPSEARDLLSHLMAKKQRCSQLVVATSARHRVENEPTWARKAAPRLNRRMQQLLGEATPAARGALPRRQHFGNRTGTEERNGAFCLSVSHRVASRGGHATAGQKRVASAD